MKLTFIEGQLSLAPLGSIGVESKPSIKAIVMKRLASMEVTDRSIEVEMKPSMEATVYHTHEECCPTSEGFAMGTTAHDEVHTSMEAWSHFGGIRAAISSK